MVHMSNRLKNKRYFRIQAQVTHRLSLCYVASSLKKMKTMQFETGTAYISPGTFPPRIHHVMSRKANKCSLRCSANGPSSHSRRSFGKLLTGVAAIFAFSPLILAQRAIAARPEGVNRPELLPQEYTTVLDLERFMASGEVSRLKEKIADLEKRTGFKIRVLTQRYPQTPGLAVRDYWNVDDNTVVMVADYFGGSGQLIKYNVGAAVDTLLPPRFWSILSANLGNKFYIEKNGEAASIINSVESIRTCLLRNGCATPPDLNPAF